jgi:YD repeat-containing protein
MRGDIPLRVSIDDRPFEAHSTYSWSGGGAVLTLSTVLPEQGLAAELISTYVGHADTATIATHLMLGPLGQPATILTAEHTHEHVDPVENARECTYDHAHQLIEHLGADGRRVSVELNEQSFTQLERVE